jgi:hypothetical protein
MVCPRNSPEGEVACGVHSSPIILKSLIMGIPTRPVQLRHPPYAKTWSFFALFSVFFLRKKAYLRRVFAFGWGYVMFVLQLFAVQQARLVFFCFGKFS